MTAVAKTLVEIVDALPDDKAREVVDSARFLQHQSDDQKWERIIDSDASRPKLDAFIDAALREGCAEPLDQSKL
jgi:hypothetical protein